jgi:hypothetical protein
MSRRKPASASTLFLSSLLNVLVPGCVLQAHRRCFTDYNPQNEGEYRQAVAMWVVALLSTLMHVAELK